MNNLFNETETQERKRRLIHALVEDAQENIEAWEDLLIDLFEEYLEKQVLEKLIETYGEPTYPW